MNVRTTVNFEFLNENFPKFRGVVLPGGTRSAKTVSTLQYVIKYCFENKGKELIIGRDTLANLKKTTLNDFEAVCLGLKGIDPLYPKIRIFDRNQSPRCEVEGNLISFAGMNDDPYRTHGMDCDVFYLNESVSVLKYCFNQLNQRCRDGWILDCNPSEPNSWVYDLESRQDVAFFRTTYEDNPFLRDEQVREIEAYEPTHPEDRHLPLNERRTHPINIQQNTADARMWSVYGQGMVHKGKEIIFPNWSTYTDDPKGYDYCFYGLDWGWNDPLAIVKVFVNGKDLFIQEILYGSEIEEETYIEKIKSESLLKNGETYIICDSSEPKSINRLRIKNIPAIAVKKKAGSVMEGIKKVQSYRIHIHEDSHNLQSELNNYKFKVDTKTDSILDVPEDRNNHLIDALRYALSLLS